MPGLHQNIEQIQLSAYASSSVKTPQIQWDEYESLCKKYTLVSVPASPKTVALYVAWLSRSIEYSSDVYYLAALAGLHNLKIYPAPDTKHFVITQALFGLKQGRFETPNKKVGISIGHLIKIRNCDEYSSTFSHGFLLRVPRIFLYAVACG